MAGGGRLGVGGGDDTIIIFSAEVSSSLSGFWRDDRIVMWQYLNLDRLSTYFYGYCCWEIAAYLKLAMFEP